MSETSENKDLFAGMNARERAAAQERQKSKKTRRKYVIIGIVVLILAALVIFVNSKAFTNGLPAVKILKDGQVADKCTVADMNYSYENAYMTFYNNYGSYMSYLMDSSKPLDEQTCSFDESITWQDYFLQEGEENARQYAAYYDAAVAAGYTLTAEQQEQIDSTIESYGTYGSAYGYTADGYIAAVMGEGNNAATLRQHMEKELVASAYLSDLYNGFEYSDEEKDAYYDENYQNYYHVEYDYAYFAASADEANGIDAETAKANAKADAESVLAGMAENTLEAFQTSAAEVLGRDATTTTTSLASFLENYATDYTEKDVKEGLCLVAENDYACYAIYVKGVTDDRYNTVSVRHILVKAIDGDGDGTYTEEELATAYDAIVAIRDEWLEGEATEDSFAQLATLKTEDEGSKDNGGLYENIYKGQMVSEFDAFCFADHKYGDYDIVYGESGSYAGYHLVFFVSADGELYSRTIAGDALRSDDYNATVDALLAPYTTEHTFMWRYVKG